MVTPKRSLKLFCSRTSAEKCLDSLNSPFILLILNVCDQMSFEGFFPFSTLASSPHTVHRLHKHVLFFLLASQSLHLFIVVAVIFFISRQSCDVVAVLEASVCIHRMVANYLEPTPVF